jgi:hypothetical protein
LHAELIADTVEGATNRPLNRNSAATVLLANNNVPGSQSVPSGSGGDEDDYSFMDVTVHSNAGSVGAAAPPSTFAQGGTTMISPAGVTVTPIVTKNHPLALYTTADAATTFSGGASCQDARSVKSRITVATNGNHQQGDQAQVASIPSESNNQEHCFQRDKPESRLILLRLCLFRCWRQCLRLMLSPFNGKDFLG